MYVKYPKLHIYEYLLSQTIIEDAEINASYIDHTTEIHIFKKV